MQHANIEDKNDDQTKENMEIGMRVDTTVKLEPITTGGFINLDYSTINSSKRGGINGVDVAERGSTGVNLIDNESLADDNSTFEDMTCPNFS